MDPLQQRILFIMKYDNKKTLSEQYFNEPSITKFDQKKIDSDDGFIYLGVESEFGFNADITFFDLSGNSILKVSEPINRGPNLIKIDWTNIKSKDGKILPNNGIYLCRIDSGTQQKVIKILWNLSPNKRNILYANKLGPWEGWYNTKPYERLLSPKEKEKLKDSILLTISIVGWFFGPWGSLAAALSGVGLGVKEIRKGNEYYGYFMVFLSVIPWANYLKMLGPKFSNFSYQSFMNLMQKLTQKGLVRTGTFTKTEIELVNRVVETLPQTKTMLARQLMIQSLTNILSVGSRPQTVREWVRFLYLVKKTLPIPEKIILDIVFVLGATQYTYDQLANFFGIEKTGDFSELNIFLTGDEEIDQENAEKISNIVIESVQNINESEDQIIKRITNAQENMKGPVGDENKQKTKNNE